MKLKPRTVLGVVGVLGFIILTSAFFGILFFGEEVKLPQGDIGKQVIGMLGMVVGTWNSAFLMIMTFNFGSSEGSKDKDAAVQKVLSDN